MVIALFVQRNASVTSPVLGVPGPTQRTQSLPGGPDPPGQGRLGAKFAVPKNGPKSCKVVNAKPKEGVAPATARSTENRQEGFLSTLGFCCVRLR